MGLEILFPKPGATQLDPLVVDIVTVHGLNGDPTSTWKHSASSHFWLQDFLPQDIKGARVLNYGYNADVVFGNSTADVWDHAKSLLGSLIDEREASDELQRPIIFIAHSLGGIIVKQALVWAHREPQYQPIKDHTLGIVFFGTPHRGSDKANYGKILANVATGVMHKPNSKLISALQSNSETLMRLTSEFKFEAPNLEILSFYETKRMSVFSSLIVEKQSALLELSHEDSQSVDANHRDMCKFDTRDHEAYKKLVKKMNRMLKGKEKTLSAPDSSTPKLRNKHFELPFDPSPYFTGGAEIRTELHRKCFPSTDSLSQNPQKRFVLYGLGGSGKTQMALKFASETRERFWGVFFIDTSSADMAEQGFSTMARQCKVGEKMEDFKRLLANSLEPWLLILDNADDPSLDISQFFPVGNRGTIIITSRNPECSCHATIGSRRLHEMESEEAINLLLTSGNLPCKDQNLRDLALPIVQKLGCLALAVNHAGASIRQRICSIEDYLDTYTRQRKKLLNSQPAQARSDYNFTVYTTWEISVECVKKLARNSKDDNATNALELLTLFGFCHFDDITEDIFRCARSEFYRIESFPWWASNVLNIIKDGQTSDWDSLAFNEAIQLLSRYSLIHVSGSKPRISLHPLVHSWIRDSLNGEEHLKWWNITLSTLALASASVNTPVQFKRQLKSHLRHCISTRQIDDLFPDDDVASDRVNISIATTNAFAGHPWKDGLLLLERALEHSRRKLGDECYTTCELLYSLAYFFNRLFRFQNSSDLLQGQLDLCIRVAGPTHTLTLDMMRELVVAYRRLGREQEALELAQRTVAICETSRNENDEVYLRALEEAAQVYGRLGRHKECVNLLKKVLAKRKEVYNEESIDVLNSEYYLADAYRRSGQHQAALDLFQIDLKKSSRVFGEDHPNTLAVMVKIALTYKGLGQPEKGIPIMAKVIDIGSRIDLDVELLQEWKEVLEYLESESAKPATTVSEKPFIFQEPPHFESEVIPYRKASRFWSRIRRRRDGSPA